MTTEHPMTHRVLVQSGVSGTTHVPFVQFVLGEHMQQFSPAKAREIAAMLLECAEAAEIDAFLVAFAREVLHSDGEHAAALLSLWRDFRTEAETPADSAEQSHDPS